ncbi:carboxylesterase family protein [Rhizosaccharibacter radicis]|uniref:carboxylesterase family protein n=1 Tax=Rhizosaccharibacter radicis TaxID=2782605 RepID=UPI003BF4DD59
MAWRSFDRIGHRRRYIELPSWLHDAQQLPTGIVCFPCEVLPRPVDGSRTPGRGVDGDRFPGMTAGAPIAGTAEGWVRGTDDGHATRFLGVPYAAPPVGALRFRPPAAPPVHAGTLSAVAYGASCPQKNSLGSGGTDENCLTLNIFRPDATGRLAGTAASRCRMACGDCEGTGRLWPIWAACRRW